MSAVEPTVRDNSAQDRRKLDELLADFHRTWEIGRLEPTLADLPADLPYRLAAVTGLAAIDLEMRWQHGDSVRVEEYLQKYPELGTADNVSIELLLAEYFAQERYEAAPDLEAFLARFPQQADDLRRLISLAKSPRLSAVRNKPSSHPSLHADQLDEPPALPEHFDRYRILKRLGHGGMGTVYLAHDTKLDRKVALKVPKIAPGSNAENLERFYREARATATITHPNLCPLYDVGECDGTPFLTMAYIEGWPLSKFIRPDKLLPQFGVATVVRIVAQAIEEAHKRGVIHRDLKPGNIMINKRGEPIVMDFGLARWVNADKEDVRLTRSGAILGAPVYMSPEQVYGDVEAMGPGCDVYSLGVILYELLTARLPFEGPTTAVLAKTLIQQPKPPSAYRPDVDPRLEEICLKAMAKKISERYATMAELGAALTEYIRAERQAQTITSLSATKMPDNGSQSALSGPLPAGGSSKSGQRKKAASGKTLAVSAHATQTAIDEELDLLDAESVPLPSASAVPLTKPRNNSRILLFAGLIGAATMAALLLLSLMLWLFWPSAKPAPAPPTGSEGTIQITLNDAPNDAVVLLDGAPVEPGLLKRPLALKPGEYRVEVKADKFESWKQTVQVVRGHNPPLEVTLRPKETIVDVKPPEPKEPQPGSFVGHSGAIKGLAWSHDGRFILSGSEDFSLRLWDPGTRAVKQVFEGHKLPVTSIALSRDGTRALSGGGDGVVILWNVPAGKPIHRLTGHTDWVRAVAISADGKRGLSGGDDKSVRLWDLDRGEQLKKFDGHLATVWTVAFSLDGQRAASGSEDHSIRLWNLETRTEAKNLTGHLAAVHSVTYLPDGRLLSASDDRTLRLWDTNGMPVKTPWVGHAGKVRGVAVSSDGKRAVSVGFGDNDNTVRLWDVDKGAQLYGLGSAPQGNNTVAFAPNDRWVISGGDDRAIRLWDVQKPAGETMPAPPTEERILEVRRFGAAKHSIDRVAVSHDGRFALSAGYDGTVRYWDLATGHEIRSIAAHDKGARYVVFSDDDKQALSCGEDKRACLWDLATGQLVKEFTGHNDTVWIALFTPDGKGVVTGAGNKDNNARLFDRETGQVLKTFKGHTKAVNSLAVSPDGKRLVTAGWDSTLRVWNMDDEKELHVFRGTPSVNFSTVAFLPDGKRVVAANGAKVKLYDVVAFKELHSFDNGHTQPVWFVAVSPGGRRLLTCGQEKHICLWDIETGKLLLKYTGHTDAIPGVAWTPDGTRYLSGSKDETLRLWDLPRNLYDPPPLPADQEAKEAKVLQPPTTQMRNYTEQVSFTADGKRALWCGDDKMVHVWDLANGKEVAKFDKHTAGVRSFALLPDGKRVLSASYDNTVRLWELSTGKEIRKFTHPKRAQTVAVTSDGKRAVSAGDDNIVFLWEVDTAHELKKMAGHEKSIYAVAVTPDDREAISGSMDKTIRRWNLETGQEIARWMAPNDVHTLALSLDGRRVLSGGKDKNVNLWDRESGDLLASFAGHASTVTCVRFSPDSHWALSSSDDKTARLWNIETGQEMARYAGAAATKGVAFSPDARSALICCADTSVRLWTLPDYTAPIPVGMLHDPIETPAKIDRVAISPDGRLALSAGYDGVVYLWDVASRTQLKAYDWHKEKEVVRYVSFSPDGKRAASCGNDKTAVVWDMDSGKAVYHIENQKGTVWGAVFSPDGTRLLTCCEDGTAAIWDADKGMPMQTFRGHTGRVNAAVWTPDGTRIVTASLDQTTRLWDAANGRELKRYTGHSKGVATVAVAPNGRYLVTGSYDNTVRLWDLETEKCLHIFEGHRDQVWNVAFSPDGRRILSGSKDKTVKLWDVERRQLVRSYDQHTDGVTGVAFHPDGRRALSGSLDQKLRLWGLPVY